MEQNYLKQKADSIKSILEQKSYISREEKTQDLIYGVTHFVENLFTNDHIEFMMKTLGRGSPEVDGSRYYYREKKYLQNSIPELNKQLETIVLDHNSEEKISIIEKTCNTSRNLYGMIGVIDLLSRKYSSETDKKTLKEISQYTMHTPQTIMCMMIDANGWSKRIMNNSRK